MVRFAGDVGIIILHLLTEFHSVFGEKVKIQETSEENLAKKIKKETHWWFFFFFFFSFQIPSLGLTFL